MSMQWPVMCIVQDRGIVAAESIKPQVADIVNIVTAGHLNPAPGGSQQKYEHLVQ